MTPIDPKILQKEWQAAKLDEKTAQDARREIEDKLIAYYNISDADEGTKNCGDFKVTCRLTHKVDGDLLQEIAAEHGISEHLPSLFRWTPAINTVVWKSTSPEITKVLQSAITSKPGRPSFKLETKE